MPKAFACALALTATLTMGACTSTPDATTPTKVGDTTNESATTPAGGSTTGAGTSTSSGTATGTASAPAPPPDQSTPEAAMTAWLGSMVAGDGKTVCNLMASDGKAIASIPAASSACVARVKPELDQLKELSSAFEGLKVSGATVIGTTATFDAATTEPAMASQIISAFKAVKIAGKWYITQ